MPSYSLWVEPDFVHYASAVAFIGRTAKRHASAPFFTPHVTLVGGVEFEGDDHALEWFCDHVEEFAGVTRAIETTQLTESRVVAELYPKSVECGEKRHQCVYVKMEKTASLLQGFRKAWSIFGKEVTDADTTAFMPHMSLAYGVEDAGTREAIADAARKELSRWFDGSEVPHAKMSMHCLSLWATDTDDDSCDSWRRISWVEFGGDVDDSVHPTVE
jgi:2'-5' RNA ligase